MYYGLHYTSLTDFSSRFQGLIYVKRLKRFRTVVSEILFVSGNPV